MSDDMPFWVPLPLRCKCGHEWCGWQPSNVPAATWIAHIRALRCPQCGEKRRLFMRSEASDAATCD